MDVARPELLTKAEVAAYLRCSKATVDRYAKRRELRFVQRPGRRLFYRADVEAYLASRSFGHRSDLSCPAGTQ